MMSTSRGLLISLALHVASTQAAAAPAAAAAAQQAAAAEQQQQYHVVEVQDSESTSAEALLSVLTEKLGATEEKVQPLIEKLEKHGKAVMVAGSQESCKKAAALFVDIGMKAEVRPLTATDLPSEYDDSDVVAAGAEALQSVLESGKGALVAFHAPWCGHCKAMVPALKEAATALKADGIPVLAIDGQSSPHLAQQLGVRAYPTVTWLQLVPGEKEGEKALGTAAYNGARDAQSLMRFAKAASAATGIGSKLPKGDEKPAAEAAGEEPKAASKLEGSKVGGSKIGGSKVGVSQEGGAPAGIQKAKLPAEANAEAKPAAAAAAAAA